MPKADPRGGAPSRDDLLREAGRSSPRDPNSGLERRMRTMPNIPDALPPGFRKLSYGVFCWLMRSPVVLRCIGALLRLVPSVGGLLGMAARAHAVKGILNRPKSFSNTAHAQNLVAGDYL